MSLEDIDLKLNSITEEIPPWARLLMECMKTVITEIKVVKYLAVRVNALESLVEVNKTVSSNLKNENERLMNLITNMEIKLDDQEQRSRNMCLLIHGVAESEDEDTDEVALGVIKNDIGLSDVDGNEIQRSHRVGPKMADKRNLRSSTSETKTRTRPIIVRFTNFKTRQAVFKNKKALKGKRVSISENLTKYRYDILKKSQAKYGMDKVWTSEGRVLTKINDRYIVITSVENN